MPYYDLNVPWSDNHAELERTLAFLHELGYDVVALTYTLTGKPPVDLTCPIPTALPFKTPPKLKILRRCTVVLTDASQNHRLSALAQQYDLLALRPTDERTLQQACQSAGDADLVSLDMTQRYPFHFKFGTLASALQGGMKLEICYSQGIAGGGAAGADSIARRNLIQNAVSLVRACRGRGVVVSSEASRAVGVRAPLDLGNLVTVWGLSQEKGKEAVSTLARSAVVSAAMKRTGYRGVVDVVYGGEQEASNPGGGPSHQAKDKGKKRAAEAAAADKDEPEQLSKRERKRRAKQSREAGEPGQVRQTDSLAQEAR